MADEGRRADWAGLACAATLHEAATVAAAAVAAGGDGAGPAGGGRGVREAGRAVAGRRALKDMEWDWLDERDWTAADINRK
jgi:hypothetical protein